jgi:hypothetical protein
MSANMVKDVQQQLLASVGCHRRLACPMQRVKEGKERKDSSLLCYCFPGTPTSWYAEKASLLTTVSHICCPKPWHIGHDIVFWWSLVSPVGYFKSQNMHIWAAANSHAIHKMHLHPLKAEMCVLSCTHIIGPIFFCTTVNTNVYLDIFQYFLNQLDDWEWTLG